MDMNKLKPPKLPLTAFFIFKHDVYEQTQMEYPYAKMTDLIQIISEKWRKLDPRILAVYEAKAAKTREIYQEQFKEYEQKRNKIRKLEGIPEKRQSCGMRHPLKAAFFIFRHEHYEQTKEEYPDAKTKELTKIIIDKWWKSDQEIHKEYAAKAEKAQESYRKDVKAYEEKHCKSLKQSLKLENFKLEVIKQENIKQEDIKQENIKQEDIKQENIKQENIKQEDIKQEEGVPQPISKKFKSTSSHV
jgi:hypothetical protein